MLSHRSFHLLMFWILFENVMSLHRTKATLIGLLEAGRVNEWVVTEKLGDALKMKSGAKAPRKPRFRVGERYYYLYWQSLLQCVHYAVTIVIGFELCQKESST